jgi:phosphoribosyl-ATP pyrophosphohydrolase
MSKISVENLDVIEELWAVIEDRKLNPKKGSYTNKLLADDKLIFKKLKEELGEIEDAVKKGKLGAEKDGAVWEASDFIYHLLVLLAAKGIELDDVLVELKRRR